MTMRSNYSTKGLILALFTEDNRGILTLMARTPHSQFINKEVMMLFSGQDYYVHVTVKELVRESSAWFYKLEFPDGTQTLECCESLLSIVLLKDKKQILKPIISKDNVIDISHYFSNKKK